MPDDLAGSRRGHDGHRCGAQAVTAKPPEAARSRVQVRLAEPRAVPLTAEQRQAAVAALAALLAPYVAGPPAPRRTAAPREDDLR